MDNTRPKDNELEINLFGPGFGECILAHCGSNEWLIIDSCLTSLSRQPFALEYLSQIRVNPAASVKLVIATHWHDDHTKGLFQIVEACENARFVCSQVLLGEEFQTLLQLQNDDVMFPSDTSEFDRVLNHFAGKGLFSHRDTFPISYAASNKRIFQRAAHANGQPDCEIFCLSPSEMAIQAWLTSLRQIISPSSGLRKRVMPPSPNQISVALHLRYGAVAVLLCADLEEAGNRTGGWKVIVDSDERPTKESSAIKIAHHGSQNGHFGPVWDEMLETNPIAVLTPYNKGSKLPTQEDVRRILSRTNRAFITSDLRDRSSRGRTGAVNRTIQRSVRKIRDIGTDDGHIRIRRPVADKTDDWRVELFGRATELHNLLNE